MGTFEEVRSLISSKLDVPEEKITESSHFVDDLGADSLDRADLVMEMEERFNVSFADQNAEEFATVGEVCKAIDSLKA